MANNQNQGGYQVVEVVSPTVIVETGQPYQPEQQPLNGAQQHQLEHDVAVAGIFIELQKSHPNKKQKHEMLVAEKVIAMQENLGKLDGQQGENPHEHDFKIEYKCGGRTACCCFFCFPFFLLATCFCRLACWNSKSICKICALEVEL